jgi:molybdate transport system substrate-binding protein
MEERVTSVYSRQSIVGFILGFAVLLCTGSAIAQGTLTISAAASLKDTIVEAETAYEKSHAKIDFSNNFGSSGTLAAQIDQGAPVDLFIVLIAPLDSKLKDIQGLADRSIRIVALGDPASVPAGQYGSQTLAALHLLDTLKAKFVLAKDVRQVLAYVETGNADAGFVYATDAMTSGIVRVVAVAPEWTHDAIIYPVAVIGGGHNVVAARQFVEFLNSPAAHTIFMKHGFTIAAQ